jgi:hypothetical protein
VDDKGHLWDCKYFSGIADTSIKHFQQTLDELNKLSNKNILWDLNLSLPEYLEK